LILQMLEHKRFLEMGDRLSEPPRLNEDVFARPNMKPPIERDWREMNVTDLGLGYREMLIRQRKRTRIINKETVSISEKMAEFAGRLEIGRPTELGEMILDRSHRPEWVVSFLASLELSRMKKMRVHQEGVYTPIYLELLERVEQFGLQFASEFDQPAQTEPVN